MMVNKAILLGNVTRDPEVRFTNNGGMLARFGIATNRVWKDETGERHDDVEFHNVTAFNNQAKIVSEYVRKGQMIYIEGRLSTSSFMRGDQKHYRTEIIAQQIQLGPKPNGESMVETSNEDVSEQRVSDPVAVTTNEPIVDDEDIPF